MKKIEVINPTRRIENLTVALSKGEKRNVNYEIQLIKNELNRQKRSAQYYEKKYSDSRASVARAQIKSINANLDIINNIQKMANQYIKNPSKIRLNSAVATLNLIDQKYTQQRKEAVQSKTTIVQIRSAEKTKILFDRLFMDNSVYNSDRLLEIGEEVKKYIPNFDFKRAIMASFDIDKHFDSGDEQEAIINTAIKGNNGLYGAIDRKNNNLDDSARENLQMLYNEAVEIMGG